MVEIKVVTGDIMSHPCDLLVLKHAEGFYGVDGMVADRVDFQGRVDKGEHVFMPGVNIEARKVLFIGVGELHDFRYERIRSFAARALALASQGKGRTTVIASPIHGPGYGLDEKESFLSLIGGFLDALDDGTAPLDLERIEIVELSAHRAERLAELLRGLGRPGYRRSLSALQVDSHPGREDPVQEQLTSFGRGSEMKPKLFVAMPFAEDFSDIWEVAIQDAATSAGVPCERIAEQSYVGDILTEIKKRVNESSGLVAVLDGANPNVFLELGYAWALGKPTVLIAHSGSVLPFDVRGQKCIMYKKISDLRTALTEEFKALDRLGVFAAD